ncbi:MAG: 16S rRNA (uracil(1498)-N(3))-methyltransferase [Oscillospiraceae bacterium]|nr:16S rRNA (uracil(1498)-N(3))-methyltransferase [Oscillospiraceae bacterium]
MARFFVSASNIFGGVAYLSSSDTEHLRSLRIRNGEVFTVCDGNGTDYSCVLTKTDRDGAEAKILGTSPSVGEPSVQVTLFVAYAKGDKNDHVVQKAVELGASAVVLFPCRRCVARPEGSALVKRVLRLSRIAEEAAKQCGRGRIPTVTALDSFEEAVERAAEADVPLLCYENETDTGLKQILDARAEIRTVSVMCGPEGGFESAEAALAVERGLRSVTLGKRILRCETAPLAALTAVMFQTGEL